MHLLFESNFISSLEGYNDYAKNIKLANESINNMVDECNKLISSLEKDPVHTLYLSFCNEIYDRTTNIVDRAVQRKYIGNSPTSNKDTCCDEIIWESILENCHDNLIFVTRDKTFKDNYIFLKKEYEVTNEKSNWVGIIYEALQDLGGEASLNEIYNKAYEIIKENYPDKGNNKNKNIQATIRGILQRYCSDSSFYGKKDDLFRNIKSGVWAGN